MASSAVLVGASSVAASKAGTLNDVGTASAHGLRVNGGKAVRAAACALADDLAAASEQEAKFTGRRQAILSFTSTSLALAAIPLPALADFTEEYNTETQSVIDLVKYTLNLEKTDPAKSDSVASLRTMSNGWVAKYRREKAVAGKPSFSNMYSALNAISGHYISFGDGYPIPKKRADRILEEVADAERALSRGR